MVNFQGPLRKQGEYPTVVAGVIEKDAQTNKWGGSFQVSMPLLGRIQGDRQGWILYPDDKVGELNIIITMIGRDLVLFVEA